MADLGQSPVANDYVDGDKYRNGEPYYPLEARVCRSCRLVQTLDVLRADEIFRADYAYFSSHSTTWLDHAKTYVERMVKRFNLGTDSRILEIASNDGYLLQFAKARGLKCLGIEPCESVALAAREKGIETRIVFFGKTLGVELAREGFVADLLTANNVLAHVPQINDFVGGVAAVLAPEGVATFEVQHLLKLMQRHQFDTIYHEHFSYFSLVAFDHLAARHGLKVFDVEELPTHGGSIRVYLARLSSKHAPTPAVEKMRAVERSLGFHEIGAYTTFAPKVHATKRKLLSFLIDCKDKGKRICGYGAPGKGNTLLNYCGIGTDLVAYTVDRSGLKTGRLTPGQHLPVHGVERLLADQPDYVLILAWNFAEEIMAQQSEYRRRGGQFILPLPEPRVL